MSQIKVSKLRVVLVDDSSVAVPRQLAKHLGIDNGDTIGAFPLNDGIVLIGKSVTNALVDDTESFMGKFAEDFKFLAEQ